MPNQEIRVRRVSHVLIRLSPFPGTLYPHVAPRLPDPFYFYIPPAAVFLREGSAAGLRHRSEVVGEVAALLPKLHRQAVLLRVHGTFAHPEEVAHLLGSPALGHRQPDEAAFG